MRLYQVTVCPSDSHRNDKATNCKYTLGFQGLTNKWNVILTGKWKVRKGNSQRTYEKEKSHSPWGRDANRKMKQETESAKWSCRDLETASERVLSTYRTKTRCVSNLAGVVFK